MFAIIQLGSAQYKVSEGDTIVVNRLAEEEGKDVSLEKVLLVAEGEDVKVGQPFVKTAHVKAKIIKHLRGEKIIAFKYRKRKESKQKIGHRQDLTALEITKISSLAK